MRERQRDRERKRKKEREKDISKVFRLKTKKNISERFAPAERARETETEEQRKHEMIK